MVNYRRLDVPCGAWAPCDCTRGRGSMNMFSLFTINGGRVCESYSGRKEAEFKRTIRPRFPGAPVPTGNGRLSKDRVPSICHHEREHISNRLGNQAVELPNGYDTSPEAMVDALRSALSAAAQPATVSGRCRRRTAGGGFCSSGGSCYSCRGDSCSTDGGSCSNGGASCSSGGAAAVSCSSCSGGAALMNGG